MPVIELHLLEGYSPEEKARLGRCLTNAVRFVLPADPEAITVMVHEMAPEHYYRGGTTRSPASAHSDPRHIVQQFLDAMLARDLVAAQGFLAPGFTMQFPGAAPMTKLEELIAWSKPRYKAVAKSYERFDALQSEGAARVVYCFGTLHGEWLDGTQFDGIRFIDRFEVVAGAITRQDVWNDMAEVKAQA
jgi:4-oxalocrotonate tautomerase family enzyme